MFYGSLTGFGGGGGAPPNFFNDIENAGLTSGLQLCLDAGAAASYDGSAQKWLDLSGNGNDLHRGADDSSATDDPTFNGTSGDLSSAEYFSTDGGDHFSYDDVGSLPSGLNGFHKDNAIFTLLAWWFVPSGGISANTRWFSTGVDGGNTHGIKVGSATDQKPNMGVHNASDHQGGNATATDSLVADAWNFVGLSINEGGSTVCEHYLQGSQNGSDFDINYSSPTTTDSTTIRIFEATSGAEASQSGIRIAGLMVWNGVVLTEANYVTLWNAQKGRFGL